MMKTMIRFLSVILFFLLLFETANAQDDFSKVYYQEFQSLQVNSVVAAFDGSYLMAGDRKYSNFLLKIDTDGDTLWNMRIVGGNFSGRYTNIVQLKDSSFLFSGIYLLDAESGILDLMCANIDADGKVLWAKSFENSGTIEPYSILQTVDDGFAICGRIGHIDEPHKRIAVVKLDKSGNPEWMRMMAGGDFSNCAYSIKQTPDTGYIVAGFTENSTPFASDAFLMKLAASGEVEWFKKYKQFSSDYNTGYEVVVLDDGYLLAMMASESLLIMKTDFSGNTERAQSYDVGTGIASNRPYLRLVKTAGGGYAVNVPASLFVEASAFLKIDSAGNVLSAKGIMMYVADIVESNDKGFLLVGNGPLATPKSTHRWEPQIGILKMDTLGQNGLQCAFDISINATNDTIVIQSVTVTSETITTISSPATLQIVSEPLSIRSGCVDVTGAVDENKTGNNIQIFPNPSTGIFTIQTTNGEQLNSIEVYNAFGERVYQKNGVKFSEIIIDLSRKNTGIYFVKLTTGQMRYSLKIVLN